MSRRFRKQGSGVKQEEPVINLTPLIDVVFVILIMFILVAPLLELDQVELADAGQALDDATVSVQESGPIRIHVRQDNTVLYNGRPVTVIELTPLLLQDKARFAQARPQLFHDRRAHFGVYQSVKNATEAAGFEQLDIVLKP